MNRTSETISSEGVLMTSSHLLEQWCVYVCGGGGEVGVELMKILLNNH